MKFDQAMAAIPPAVMVQLEVDSRLGCIDYARKNPKPDDLLDLWIAGFWFGIAQLLKVAGDVEIPQ